jgi:hypothetical protein
VARQAERGEGLVELVIRRDPGGRVLGPVAEDAGEGRSGVRRETVHEVVAAGLFGYLLRTEGVGHPGCRLVPGDLGDAVGGPVPVDALEHRDLDRIARLFPARVGLVEGPREVRPDDPGHALEPHRSDAGREQGQHRGEDLTHSHQVHPMAGLLFPEASTILKRA